MSDPGGYSQAPIEPVTPIGFEPVVETTPEERLWALIAHLFGALGYFGGFFQCIGPFVVYLVYKDRSRFVAFHALQTLYLHLAILVAGAFAVLLAFFTCGFGLLIVFPLMAVLPLGALIYSIMGGLQAHEGRLFEYWVVGRWAREQVGI